MALPNSRVMIHQPALGGAIQGQGTDLEIQAREIMRMRSQMEQLLAEQTGQPLEKVTRDIDRDKIMTADEAKEYGIVDVVLTQPQEEPAQRCSPAEPLSGAGGRSPRSDRGVYAPPAVRVTVCGWNAAPLTSIPAALAWSIACWM